MSTRLAGPWLALLAGCVMQPQTQDTDAADTSWVQQNALQTPMAPLDVSFVEVGAQLGTAADQPVQFTPMWWGRSGDHRALGNAPVHTTSTGVIYEHPGIDAWFETTERGLRHGFEVHNAPPGTGPLQVALALGTDRSVMQTVEGLRLIGDHDVLTYTGLAAWDADGRFLDSWMDLRCDDDECTVALTVDDSWARYPLTIDPEGGPEDNCVGDPNKDDPGYCGCFFFDLDLDESGSAETCVHIDAEVYGMIGAGSQIFSEAYVHERATVSTDVELGDRTQVHAAGSVGANTEVGDDGIVGRRAVIGADSTVGADVIISRQASLGDRTSAGSGDITLGYGSQIGDDATFQGPTVMIGNLVTAGVYLTVGANVVIARGATIGDNVTIGAGTVIGPDVTIGDGTVIGADVRIRKDTQLGARVTLSDDVRIGRSALIGEGVEIGEGTTLRSDVDIGANNTIDADLYIQRGTVMEPITSVPGNDPPVAVADDAQTFVGKPVRILALRNDSDPDGDSLTLVNVQNPAGGQAVIDGGAIVFTPGAGQTGVVTFNYTVEDSVGQTDSATVTVTVVAADVPPEVVITSPSDLTESGNSSHVVTLTGTVADDNGIVTVAYQLDDASPVTMGSSAGPFSLPVTIPAVTQILRVIATDTAGQSTTALVTFTNCDNASAFNHSWTGAVDTDWDQAGNWSNNVVPSTTHNVFICGNTTNKPVLQANTTTAKLWVDPGGQLDTNGFLLTTNGDVVARDIVGSGTVRLQGSNPTIWGEVPNLQMYSAAHLFGPLTITGNGSGHGSLAISGNQLTVDGNWTQSGAATTGGLLIRDPKDRVSIFGDLSFTGGTNSQTGGAMTDGELWVYGNVAQTTSSYNTGMQPTGTVFVFAGSSPQTLTVASNTASYLGDVRIQNPAGVTMNAPSYLTVKGKLEMVGDGMLQSNRLRFTDSLPTTSAFYDVAVTQVGAHMTLTEDWDGTLDRLEILNGYSLSPNGHVARVDGDFYQYASNASYGLQMDNSDDYVIVTGDATFHGGSNSTSPGAMAAGELHLQGDFAQTTVASTHPYTFQPTGMAVVFDGTSPQTISFASVGATTNYFDDLRIENPQGVTDTSSGMFVTGQLEMVGQASLTATKVRVTSALPLTNDHYNVTDTEIRGHISASADWVGTLPKLSILNGYSLIPNTHHLTIDGNFYQYASNASYGLQMDHVTDQVTITGDATFHGGSSTPSTGAMAAGVLHLRGDFAQTTVASSHPYTFQPTGMAVVFDGTSPQTISFASVGATTNYFDDLRIENPQGVTDTSSGMFVTGQLEMVGQAALTATKVRVTSHLPLTNDHYNVTDTEIRGHISASADWVGLLPKLSILNGYSLTPNTHQLTIDGNFYQYASNASYGLQMDNSDDYVIVTGDATFHGGSSGTTPGAMADGELHLRGDFAQTTVASTHPYTFQPTGMAVVFDGTNPQTISFDSVGATTNYFDDLRIENSQGVTDTSSGMFVTGQLEMVGLAALTATKVRVTSALPLTNDHYNVSDTEVRGHISASGDWVGLLPKLSILNGYSLTPNTHHLTIDGNFYQYASNASYGLQMDYGTDQVTITGDATFHGGSNASSTGAMTAGELHLGGNFAQTTVAPTHPYTFQPTGTAVVFDGTNPQTISFASVGATTNYFDDLRIENPQGVTDTSSGMFVTGQLEMVGQGALTATKVRVTSALPLTNDHYSVTDTEIRGHINASADWVGLLPKLSLLNGYSLTANGHHLTIDGDYAQSSSSGSYGLQLHNGNDRVTITGDAVFTGATTNSVNTALTAGEVWFQGNFQQVTTNGFQPNGTATVFNGGGTHTVSFASSGGNWFDDMTVAPGNALNITTTTQVNGASTLNGDITNASTFSTLGTLTLANGITVTNNGTIRYRAGYTDNGATIIGPSPVAY